MDSARALIARGWGVSLVSRCLRVSRAQLHVILRRTDDWMDGRRSRHTDDTDVLLRIHHVIGELPTYGYRRVWALLRRQAELDGMPAINAKRVYRIMRQNALLLDTKSSKNVTVLRTSARATLVGSTQKKPGSTQYQSSSPISTGYYDEIKYVSVTNSQSNSDGTFPPMALPSTIPNQYYFTRDDAGLILQRTSDNTTTQTFPVYFDIRITKKGDSYLDDCRIRLPNAITFTSRDQKEVLLDTNGNCTSIWNNSASVKGSIKFIEPSGTDLQLSGISGLDWNKSIQPTGKIYLSPGKTKNGEYNINTEVTYP